MASWVWFLLGFWSGGLLGVMVMALLVMSRRGELPEEGE